MPSNTSLQLKRKFERLANKKKKRKGKGKSLVAYREKWREKGPIWFAENVLSCPIDVPIHPDFDPNNNPPIFCEGCERKHTKFRENGVPYHIVLSDYQKRFLYDVWKNDVDQVLISASRGAGKTFTFAIWYCWSIVTREKHSVTLMGGSMRQSKLCQSYIDDWRYDVPVLMKIIDRSLQGIERYVTTIWRSRIDFTACSTTAARGPHVNQVGLDEVCTAEDKSEEGGNAVKAAMWQRTGKRVTTLFLASTAHYIQGMFYEYMIHPDKYGFKVYQWAIAKHISGKEATKIYTDKEPTHWKSNVWWVTTKEIEKLRRSKSDEEWLCEALGGASMASGAVFKKKDLDISICSICDECEPYVWNECQLARELKLGVESDPTKYVIERRCGFDYGVSESPCAINVIGRKKDVVFVLFNDEQIGLREEEKISWIHDNCQQWKTWIFIPDPAVAGKHLNEKMEDKGYAVYTIPEHDKMERVYNVINFVEKHKIVIPKAFWYLTTSLRKLAWDRNGKIRKVSDHSFDSLAYGLVDFTVEESGDMIEDYLSRKKKVTADEMFR